MPSADPASPVKYEINKPFPKDFLPVMVIADKAGVPDELEMYASSYAYAAPAARLKLKSINMTALPAGTEFEPDPFDWLFNGGVPGFCHGFSLKVSHPVEGMAKFFEEHLEGETGVIGLGRDYKYRWFNDYHIPRIMFPSDESMPVGRRGAGINVINPLYGKNYLNMRMKRGQSVMNDTITYEHHADKEVLCICICCRGRSLSTTITPLKLTGLKHIRGGTYAPTIIYDTEGETLYKLLPLMLH